MSLLDYEIFAIIVMMILDIIVGTIDHNFFTRDSNSGGAIKSLFSKLAVTCFLIFILIMVHAPDFVKIQGIGSIIDSIKSACDIVVVMLLYFELTSILAHMHNITGLDFLAKLPMVKQEIDHKAVKAQETHKAVKNMKENYLNESTNTKQDQ